MIVRVVRITGWHFAQLTRGKCSRNAKKLRRHIREHEARKSASIKRTLLCTLIHVKFIWFVSLFLKYVTGNNAPNNFICRYNHSLISMSKFQMLNIRNVNTTPGRKCSIEIVNMICILVKWYKRYFRKVLIK